MRLVYDKTARARELTKGLPHAFPDLTEPTFRLYNDIEEMTADEVGQLVAALPEEVWATSSTSVYTPISHFEIQDTVIAHAHAWIVPAHERFRKEPVINIQASADFYRLPEMRFKIAHEFEEILPRQPVGNRGLFDAPPNYRFFRRKMRWPTFIQQMGLPSVTAPELEHVMTHQAKIAELAGVMAALDGEEHSPTLGEIAQSAKKNMTSPFYAWTRVEAREDQPLTLDRSQAGAVCISLGFQQVARTIRQIAQEYCEMAGIPYAPRILTFSGTEYPGMKYQERQALLKMLRHP
jgi:hypothetical protein